MVPRRESPLTVKYIIFCGAFIDSISTGEVCGDPVAKAQKRGIMRS